MKRFYLALLILPLCLQLAGCGTTFREVIADGPIEEDYGVRTRGTELEDKDIESKIAINVRFEPAFSQSAVQATSYNRIVLLTGQVSDPQKRQLAADMAGKIRHVRSVHNELEIGEPAGLATRSKDSLLHTKIRARLMASGQVDASRVHVVVENGSVYLMGLLTRPESQRVIDAVKEVAGLSRIVKVFEYIER
ncbi:MAG TPA: BON domain-containing protein [Pseudomonadales bacterium]